VVLAATAGLSACSKGEREAVTVKDAIARTERLPMRYSYTETVGSQTTTVRGLIADDYRSKAELVVDGAPRVDEVVDDDAVADRFWNAAAVTLLARRSPDGRLLPPPASAAVRPPGGISVIDALTTGRWVADPVGAPAAFGTALARHPLGEDAFFDARDVWNYALRAIDDSARVRKYDAQGIENAYKDKEDPFPKPAHGAKLVRYDLEQRPLPGKSARNGANQAVPDTFHFRKLVIFVEGGRVVRIMETIDVVHKLPDLIHNYDLKLHGTPQEQAGTAIAGINTVRVGQGNDPIRVRTMDFQLSDFGIQPDIPLPGDAVQGSLALLVNRGLVPPTAAGGGGAAGAPTAPQPVAPPATTP